MPSWIDRQRSLLLRSDARAGWLIFLLALAIRIPFIVVPPGAGLYNVDELALALTILDRWLGVQPMDLIWPGMLLRFAGVVAFSPELLWALVTDRSLDKFGQVLFRYYDDPSSIIIALRTLSAVAGAAAAVAGYQLARSLSGSSLAGVTAALAITLLPISLQHTLMAKADAVAFAFCIWAARFALCQPVRPILVGILTAAAVASRVVSVAWLMPVFLAAAVLIWNREGPRRLATDAVRSAGAGLAGVILFYPYLWLDPLRAIKAVAGNLIMQGHGLLPVYEFLSLEIPGLLLMSLMIAAAILAAFASLATERYRVAGLVLGVTLTLLLVWLLVHGFDYWRYAFGALIPFIVLFSMMETTVFRRAVLPGLLVVTAIFSVVALFEETQFRRGPNYREGLDAIEKFCRQGDTIWLDDSILYAMPGRVPMPTSAVREIAVYLESADISRAVRDWIESLGVAPRAALALQSNFDEADRVAATRWRFRAAYHESPLSCPFHIFHTTPGTEDKIGGGFVRATLSGKSLADVRAALRDPAQTAVIRVIGSGPALAKLGLPMENLGRRYSVVTKKPTGSSQTPGG